MPSDSNGVYSLPDGYEAVTGGTIQANQHNPPLEDLASAMSLRLMRTGVAPMTGPLKIADGSVGSPGLKFGSDGSTGLYKTANGIGISVGGTKVAEFTSSGASRMIGELISWTLLSAPAGWVLPYGQTLSRTTYADLWTIAQTEIAGGNTFYNNGDGSTTFGIGDLRGRVIAGKDDMGGTAASRLTSTYFGTSASVIGAANGNEACTLSAALIPTITSSGSGSVSTTSTQSSVVINASAASINVAGGASFYPALNQSGSIGSVTSTGTATVTTTSTNTGGAGPNHKNVQPTLICNYLLYAGA